MSTTEQDIQFAIYEAHIQKVIKDLSDSGFSMEESIVILGTGLDAIITRYKKVAKRNIFRRSIMALNKDTPWRYVSINPGIVS